MVELELNITIEDIANAIGNMKGGKTPEIDAIYLLFIPLLDMYQELFESVSLPPSINVATITLLLKPNKPAPHFSAYRPISLLNYGYKILCKL